jgi:SAM-dependent methyltransferase
MMQEGISKPVTGVARFFRHLRSIGLSGIVADWWCHFYNRLTDRRLSIDTSGCFEVGLRENCHEYLATDYGLLTKAIGVLTAAEEDVVFLDYGCGKGRAVAVAAMRPFKHVIGVELGDGLLEVARKNLSRMQSKVRCSKVSLHHVDATQFDVPDDVNAVFFFNPFRGEIMTAVIGQLDASLRRCPRTIMLFFLYPPGYAKDPFESLDGWSLKTEIPVGRHLFGRLPVYESVPDFFADSGQ